MISLQFFYFTKRNNSTKQPLLNEALFEENVVLKSATSLENPIFILSNTNSRTLNDYLLVNYIKWDDRYYWVREKHIVNDNVIEFDCRIDVLASNKTLILNSSQYVARSSSHGSVYNPDYLITFKNKNLYGYRSESLDDVFTSNPLMLIEVANTQGISFDVPYALTTNEANVLKNELYGQNFLDFFKNWFSNPMECLIRAQYTAWNCGNLDDIGVYENIYVGSYQLNSMGRRFYSNKVAEYTKYIDIPWIYNDFRRQAPYTEILMYLPFVGIINLDATLLSKYSRLQIKIKIEVLTGNIIYELLYDFDEGYNKFAMYSGNCNSYEPFGEIKPADPISMLPAIAMVFGGLSMGNPMIAATGVANGMQAAQQHSIINGNISSALSAKLEHAIQILCISKESNAEPNDIKTIFGNPMNDYIRLSNLSGYCQCQNASVALPEDSEIIEEVNNYLNGGFYIE